MGARTAAVTAAAAAGALAVCAGAYLLGRTLGPDLAAAETGARPAAGTPAPSGSTSAGAPGGGGVRWESGPWPSSATPGQDRPLHGLLPRDPDHGPFTVRADGTRVGFAATATGAALAYAHLDLPYLAPRRLQPRLARAYLADPLLRRQPMRGDFAAVRRAAAPLTRWASPLEAQRAWWRRTGVGDPGELIGWAARLEGPTTATVAQYARVSDDTGAAAVSCRTYRLAYADGQWRLDDYARASEVYEAEPDPLTLTVRAPASP